MKLWLRAMTTLSFTNSTLVQAPKMGLSSRTPNSLDLHLPTQVTPTTILTPMLTPILTTVDEEDIL